jgi:aminoglycoside phosphotransferase family enzyme/predicted kinase
MAVSGAFPHPVTRIEIRDTHVSRVILTGPFAYKIKKSVRFDFIDTTTLAQRRHLCEEELRLNRRLAPDIYLGVVPITKDADGVHVDGAGPIVEYAVRMSQFDPSQELASLLEHAQCAAAEIADLGATVARFHLQAATAPPDPQHPHTEALRSAVLSNMALLAARAEMADSPTDLGRLVDWTHDGLHSLRGRLALREQLGFIREVHGDLHARNIVRWRGRLTPFDCLEFDPALRWIDVMNDAAFLVMDLVAHQRRDLALTFLNSYLEITGDYAGMRLLPFYAVYRALTRAKVDSLQAEQNPQDCGALLQRLRARIQVAAQFIDVPHPSLVIMHGPSGSGKSWLSEQLLPGLEAIRIRSDVERKRIIAAQAQDRPVQERIYSPEVTRRTYARALECAEACLDGGFAAIVDATFLNRSDRQDFRALAARLQVPYVIVSCTADEAVLRRRIATRREKRADPSDADADVLAEQMRTLGALDASEQPHAIVIDTSQPGAAATAGTEIPQRIARLRAAGTPDG